MTEEELKAIPLCQCGKCGESFRTATERTTCDKCTVKALFEEEPL